jgi:hypothetical protein
MECPCSWQIRYVSRKPPCTSLVYLGLDRLFSRTHVQVVVGFCFVFLGLSYVFLFVLCSFNIISFLFLTPSYILYFVISLFCFISFFFFFNLFYLCFLLYFLILYSKLVLNFLSFKRWFIFSIKSMFWDNVHGIQKKLGVLNNIGFENRSMTIWKNVYVI